MIRLAFRWLYWRFKVYRTEHKPSGPLGAALARFWVTLWVRANPFDGVRWLARCVAKAAAAIVPVGPVPMSSFGSALGYSAPKQPPHGFAPDLHTLMQQGQSQAYNNALANQAGLSGTEAFRQSQAQMGAGDPLRSMLLAKLAQRQH